MALTKEEQELIIRVGGAAEVQRLTDLLQQEEATLRHLIEAQATGAVSVANYEINVKRLSASMAANQAAIIANNAAVKSATSFATAYRQNIVALGYGFNDFFSVSGNLSQRLNSVANNLPGMLAGFGHWGLALSAILPIIAMLLPQLAAMAKAMGFEDAPKVLAETVEKLKAKIKELTDKPVKFAVDVTDLNHAQAALEKFQKGLNSFRELEEMRTAHEQRSAAAVKDVLRQAGGKKLADQLRGSAAKEIEAADPGIAEGEARGKAAKGKAERLKRDAALVGRAPGGAALAGQLYSQAAAAEAEAKRATEDAKMRRQAVVARAGDAAARVGQEKDEAERGRPEALNRRLAAVGRDDLAAKLAKTTKEAMKKADEKRRREAFEQEQGHDRIGQFLGNTVRGAAQRLGETMAENREIVENRRQADRDAATRSPEDVRKAREIRKAQFEKARGLPSEEAVRAATARGEGAAAGLAPGAPAAERRLATDLGAEQFRVVNGVVVPRVRGGGPEGFRGAAPAAGGQPGADAGMAPSPPGFGPVPAGGEIGPGEATGPAQAQARARARVKPRTVDDRAAAAQRRAAAKDQAIQDGVNARRAKKSLAAGLRRGKKQPRQGRMLAPGADPNAPAMRPPGAGADTATAQQFGAFQQANMQALAAQQGQDRQLAAQLSAATRQLQAVARQTREQATDFQQDMNAEINYRY